MAFSRVYLRQSNKDCHFVYPSQYCVFEILELDTIKPDKCGHEINFFGRQDNPNKSDC